MATVRVYKFFRDHQLGHTGEIASFDIGDGEQVVDVQMPKGETVVFLVTVERNGHDGA